MYTSNDIQFITDFIAKEINPEEIILFGSYARKSPSDDSDLDLLVLMKEEIPRDEKRKLLYQIREMLFSKDYQADIVLNSKDNYDKYKKYIGTIFNSVYKEGIVLWKRN